MSTEQYEKVCREHFEELKGLIEKVQVGQNKMHRKLFESNGERALVEVIRENTEWRKKMEAMFKKAVAGVVAMIAAGHGVEKLIEFLMQ